MKKESDRFRRVVESCESGDGIYDGFLSIIITNYLIPHN